MKKSIVKGIIISASAYVLAETCYQLGKGCMLGVALKANVIDEDSLKKACDESWSWPGQFIYHVAKIKAKN